MQQFQEKENLCFPLACERIMVIIIIVCITNTVGSGAGATAGSGGDGGGGVGGGVGGTAGCLPYHRFSVKTSLQRQYCYNI